MSNYEKVRKTILENHTWHAGRVARHLGLDDEMGYDAAAEYVKNVRTKMRHDGDLIMPEPKPKYAHPEERLEDVLMLFELRGYNVKKKAAQPMLLAMCYWKMRLSNNFTAVKETMEMNDRLKRSLSFPEIEQICNSAQEYGFNAMDEEKNAEARAKGFPDAGLNWTSDSLFHKFMVTEEELEHMKTIGQPFKSNQPWGVPNPDRERP